MFRNQRPELVQRSSGRSSGPRDTQIGSGNSLVNTTISFAGVPYGISSSPEDLAIPLVFHYFSQDESDSGGLLIPKTARVTRETKDAALSAALSALGYAILSNTRRSPRELIEGRRQYGKAVRLTSNALQNPAVSRADEILGTVILLAMFEVSIFPTTSSFTVNAYISNTNLR